MAEPPLPYMKLWTKDIAADGDCRAMSDAEFGRYMRLLIQQWNDGQLPQDAKAVARIAMLDSAAGRSLRSLLDSKFPVGDDGLRRNPRLTEERNEATERIETNRANGKRGGRPSKNPPVNQTDNREKTDRLTEGLSQKKPNGSIRASDSDSDSDSGSSGGGGAGGGDTLPADDPAVDAAANAIEQWSQQTRGHGLNASEDADVRQRLAAMPDKVPRVAVCARQCQASGAKFKSVPYAMKTLLNRIDEGAGEPPPGQQVRANGTTTTKVHLGEANGA